MWSQPPAVRCRTKAHQEKLQQNGSASRLTWGKLPLGIIAPRDATKHFSEPNSWPTDSRESHRIPAQVLQFHQPVRGLGQNGEGGELAAHHRDFIALMKSGTDVTILVDFIGKIFALGNVESLPGKKLGSSREQADAMHPMPFRFRHQSLHQPAAPALALRAWRNRDRPDLGQVRAIEMERAAADDASFLFEDDEISDVLADLRQRAGQQSAVTGIGRDQIVDVLSIRQNGFTRAHGPPRAGTQFSFSPPQSPAALGLVPYRQPHRGSPARLPAAGSHRSPGRTPGVNHANHPGLDPEAHNPSPDIASPLCRSAGAPAVTERRDSPDTLPPPRRS